MKWSEQAEAALRKVPFFVRKRVRKRVEEEAVAAGAREVTIEHVVRCQQRFMKNQEEDVRGFQVETCFGPGGCPNSVGPDPELARRIEEHLAGLDLKGELKKRVKGLLKMHHEFRVSVSDCPNGCSRPQIVDVGLLGALRPEVTGEDCSGCGACVAACREEAITLRETGPVIAMYECLACGQCAKACPTGTLAAGRRGYRILVGGKLGRHPQLGRELPGIFTAEEALETVKRCAAHFLAHNREGERFGEILQRTGYHELGRGK
ncbi:MAG: 4Fe-4S binding protein [Desulfobacteraceae bacterium]|nr:4Fe-4S binding protein [Desulfobacteraceae bacterium]